MEQPAMKIIPIEDQMVSLHISYDQLRFLEAALLSVDVQYGDSVYKRQISDLRTMIRAQIDRLERPAKEEAVLKEAAAILRGRGITEWKP